NPESKLLEIDKKLSKGEANYASAVAVDATLSLLDVFLEIATDEEGASNAELERDISRVEREQNHTRRVTNLNTLREEWEMETIRKTSLNPNHQIQGKGYFPITLWAKYVHLHLPLNNYLFDFVFTQKIHSAH
ncbi:MAG: hypothetical protein ACE5HI_20815, partial [bacterium]